MRDYDDDDYDCAEMRMIQPEDELAPTVTDSSYFLAARERRELPMALLPYFR